MGNPLRNLEISNFVLWGKEHTDIVFSSLILTSVDVNTCIVSAWPE